MGSSSRMCSISIMDVEPSRRYSASEDVEEDPDRWCSYDSRAGKSSGKSRVNGYGTCASRLGRLCRERRYVRSSGHLPKKLLSFSRASENPPEEYGPWQWAAAFGRATGRFGADAFVLQEDGKLRCPAGANLWLSARPSRKCFHESRLSISLIRPIVSSELAPF
jgi:hypothetical protein